MPAAAAAASGPSSPVAVALDQGQRGWVDVDIGLRYGVGGLEQGIELPRHDLAELDAPLIERVEAPDDAFGEHHVLVRRDQLPKRRRCELGRRNEFVGRFPGVTLRGTTSGGVPSASISSRTAERQGRRLREVVRHEQVVHVIDVVVGFDEADEIGGTSFVLVQQLVEGVLSIRAPVRPRRSPRSACRRYPSSCTDLPLLSMVSCCK